MNRNKKILGIIPARFDSVRFPGKPLALINNKHMVQWVYEGVEGAVDYLVVATDDLRIRDAVSSFGGRVLMTSPTHRSGTERCNEVVEILEGNGEFRSAIVVNIQGDEPLIRREQIAELVSCFDREETEIATLVSHFREDEDISDPNSVKAVVDKYRKALYFSRYPIPYLKNSNINPKDLFLKHIGIYGYRTGILKSISGLSPSKLEVAESLEQLRWLENGFVISTQLTTYRNLGVDTPEDLENLTRHLSNSV